MVKAFNRTVKRDPGRVGVLMGGTSGERQVSLKTGAAVLSALDRLGYRTAAIEVADDIVDALRRRSIDVAFIALHGRFGEDGTVQGLLELLRIPYTGSGVLASALGMNKWMSRKVFRFHNLPVPEFLVFRPGDPLPDVQALGYPLVVKPNSQGSSLGVSIVRTHGDLAIALEQAGRLDSEVLVERYIEGKEVHVAILGDEALGGIEVEPKTEFYDYSAKYIPGMSTHIFPARLAPKVYERALHCALLAHRALGCRGYSRVDLLVDGMGTPYVLEVNTLPGMTETSLFPEIARGVGIAFEVLVERILWLAIPADPPERRK